MLIENVQEPLGALEVGQKRELLTDATHLHLLFPGSAIFCLFVSMTKSPFSTPWSAIVLSFFFLLETRPYPAIFYASDWQKNINVMLSI